MKALLMVLVSLLCVGCGYRLAGTGHSLPGGADSIAIDDFIDFSTFPESKKFISNAIREEFLRRSHLKHFMEKNQADLVLEGRIDSFEIKPSGIPQSGRRGEYQLKATVSLRLVDQLNHSVLFDGESMVFVDVFEMNSADFFTQDARIIENIAVRLGKFYVSAVFEDF
jgi:outer membrane lipopolysaccharide assembly protein LptE/RlpB